MSGLKKKKKYTPHEQKSSDSDEFEIEPEENWRGKNKNVKAKEVSTQQINKRRSKKSILNKHDPLYIYKKIPLLKNGYNDKNIITTSTCAFDSIYAVYTYAYLDYDEIKDEYNAFAENGSVFCAFIRNLCSIDKANKNLKCPYADRNNILLNIFSTKEHKKNNAITIINNISYIDCFTGLGAFLSQLILSENNQCLSSIKIDKSCKKCGWFDIKHNIFVPVKLRSLKLNNIQESLEFREQEFSCMKCGSPTEKLYEIGEIIVLETEPAHGISRIALNDVSDIIHINNQPYQLHGAIERDSSRNHFVGYAKRKNQIWKQYDDLDSNNQKNYAGNSLQIFMLFYIQQNLN